MTVMVAINGFERIGQPKPRETIEVSSAAIETTCQRLRWWKVVRRPGQ